MIGAEELANISSYQTLKIGGETTFARSSSKKAGVYMRQ
jgi:hypothetical protein